MPETPAAGRRAGEIKAAGIKELAPYLKKFRGKIFVFKIGGEISSGTRFEELLKNISSLKEMGIHPVIVHGAGPELTSRLEEIGMETRFDNEGRRITDKPTLAAARQVFSQTNAEIARKLREIGAKTLEVLPKAIPAFDTVRAMPLSKTSQRTGIPAKVRSTMLKLQIKLLGKIPVIAPLGTGRLGRKYNVNADDLAAQAAASLGAEKLFFVTNTEGVKKEDKLISTLTEQEAEKHIENKVITGGMVAKVRAGLRAMKGGCNKVHIVDGRNPDSIVLEIFTKKGAGTQIIHSE